MTLEDAVKILSENNASSLFEAKVPSTGQVLQFRPMTVGVRKSLAKFAIGEESKDGMVKFQTAKMAMLKTLCTTPIDEKTITVPDFISLLASVRSNSSIDDLILNMTCGGLDCGKKFTHRIDFDEIIKKCSEFKFKTSAHEFKDKAGRNYKMVLTYPSALDAFAMDAQEMEPEVFKLTYPYIFVKRIFINDNEIENFSARTMTERMLVIDGLPGEILYNTLENNLYKVVYEEYGTDNVMNLYGELKCPGCHKNMEGVVTSDNFFTI